MQIDWNHFTPLASLAGGLAIGLAAGLYVLGVGRVAGIAGIVGSALQSLLGWRPGNASPAWLFIAELLVGFGVRLGNGCTSGHGVCGLSRLSRRSLANVIAFMAAGVVTVFVMRLLGAA